MSRSNAWKTKSSVIKNDACNFLLNLLNSLLVRQASSDNL